jgi:hypothetical protein
MVADPPCALSIATCDLIQALTLVSGQTRQYQATGTAAGEDGSVVTSIVATDADGSQHHFDVTISRKIG